jgi:hypothetical protein
LQFLTDAVQDVHPRVLLNVQDQTLALPHVERPGLLDL